ncbi:protein HEXIM2 [Drosophila kikkawai]|uniref:Protein HEXIM2 n=1 Tax=Drosophila kikkawai TaxID=30033 RepID=A0A6P4JS06_DROKI|nr:uncharacterized protein DDB_G0271670 [Drosophila kikkawai]
MAEAVKTENNSKQRPLDGGGGAGSGGGGSGGGVGSGMPKRKHRRGKKSKLLPKKTKNQFPQWKLDMPTDAEGHPHPRPNSRTKLVRSRSLLVPYNTNRFLMEEHMSDLNKDDSDDNCFNSQTEDQDLFLSKEFSNVYERARLERLETMNKQELIQECLQIEDRYSKAQNTSNEFSVKIRAQEEKMRQLTRENQFLRSHFLRSCSTGSTPGPAVGAAAAAAAASPPSAVAPTPSSAVELQARQQPPQQPPQPTPMDSSSEDSESDSSSTTSSTTSSTSSSSSSDGHEMGVAGLNIANGHAERGHERSRSRSRSRSPIHLNGHANEEERQRLLDSSNQMDEDEDNSSDVAKQGTADAAVK